MYQGLVDIMIGHTISRQSAQFVDLITILRKNVSKGSDRRRKKLARLVFHLTEIRNVRLGNAIDVIHTFDLRQTLPKYHITILNEFEALANLANGPIIFTDYAESEISTSTIQ